MREHRRGAELFFFGIRIRGAAVSIADSEGQRMDLIHNVQIHANVAADRSIPLVLAD